MILVSHRERAIEVVTKSDDGGWKRSRAQSGGRVRLTAVDRELVVDEIYYDALSGAFLA